MNPPNVPGPSNPPPNVPGSGSGMPANMPGGSSMPPNVPGGSSIPPGGSGMPPAGGGMPPYTPPPAKASGGLFTTRNIIIGLIALVVLCVCGCGAVFAISGGAIASVFSNVAAPAAVGTAFMTDLVAGNDSQAYALCTPALQNSLGSSANFTQRIDSSQARPTSWTFSNTSLNNNRTDLTGTANFVGGRTGTVSIAVVKVGNDWKVDAFNLQPQ